MDSDQTARYKLYGRLYGYSKKYFSFERNFANILIKLLLNSIFGVLLYFSVETFTMHEDKVYFFIFIACAVLVSLLADLAWENSENKQQKKQQKTYAKAFTLLNEDFNKAQKAIRARDEFLSIASHELKTPLTIMLLKLRSELDDIKSSSLANFSVHKLIEVLKNSEKQVNWLGSIVNDLLDVSLITTGRVNLTFTEVNLVSLTKEVKQSFSEIIKKEKYKVIIDSDGPVIGKWDKVRLEQVITNLFSNALKYGGGNPIYIRIFKTGKIAKFIIKDNGVGISPEEQKVIFELFKRSDGAGLYKKGLGVGLFIASQIVKIHGGKLKVSSKLGINTSFTIELPC